MKIETQIIRLLQEAFKAGRDYENFLHWQDPTNKKPSYDKWIEETKTMVDKISSNALLKVSLPKGYCCKYCGRKKLENNEGKLIELK